jgi:hypothetical protein
MVVVYLEYYRTVIPSFQCLACFHITLDEVLLAKAVTHITFLSCHR